jgi:hypothetical protein
VRFARSIPGNTVHMDIDPLRILAETDGYFTRAHAREAGVADRDILRLLRQGVWCRIRRGYYTFTDTWKGLDATGRHRVRSRAVVDSLGSNVCLSHVSALVVLDIETWGIDLSKVHVTRLDKGAGRVEGDVVHHVGRVPDDDVVEIDGMRVMVADRALIEAASLASGEGALVAFESGLYRKKTTHDDLRARFEQMEHWPHTQHLHVPIRMASDQSQSVGESRGNWLFWAHRLPRPEQQFEVYDDDGVLVGTCDWAWPEHETLGEFDGHLKYYRLLAAGQQPGDVVFAEKQREDLLRRLTGYMMVRLVWSDYDRPRSTAQRVEQVLRRSTK